MSVYYNFLNSIGCNCESVIENDFDELVDRLCYNVDLSLIYIINYSR